MKKNMAGLVKKNAQISKKEEVSDTDRAIIDEYFLNGFNATQAVLKVTGQSYNAARVTASQVMNNPRNQGYIRHRQHQHTALVNLEAYQVLQELKNMAFADVTQFIGLDEKEVQELPHDVRRTLKKVTVKEKSYKNAQGKPTTERTFVYEIHDKLTALEKIGRHIGFYEADNRQRSININLNDFDNVTLNNILQVVEKAHENKGMNDM